MLHDTTSIRTSRARVALVAAAALLAVLPLSVVARTPAAPQALTAPASPGTAVAPARPVTRSQPAAPATPGTAPRTATRVQRERSSLEQALAEQQRSLEEIRGALEKLRADTIPLQALEQAARDTAALEQSDEFRKMVEFVELQKSLSGTATLSERQTKVAFLETQLRAMTRERDELKLELQRLTENVDALRAQLERERAGRSQGR